MNVRQKAIDWYNNLTLEEKSTKFKSYLKGRGLECLTGREIEQLYNVEQNRLVQHIELIPEEKLLEAAYLIYSKLSVLDKTIFKIEICEKC